MNCFPLHKNRRKKIERLRKEHAQTVLYMRLSALLWLDDGKSVDEVAKLLGICARTVRNWLKLYKTGGLDLLCKQNHKGDPGNLTSQQQQELVAQAKTGKFRTVKQIVAWVQNQFHVTYSLSGMKLLLRRLGLTYHQVKGFLWKGNPVKQQEFVKKYHGQRSAARRKNSKKTVFYFVDACHPIWGLDLVYRCWLPRGMRFHVPLGSGRKRLNILAAYNPDTHDLIKLTCHGEGGNIDKFKFEILLEMIKEQNPEAERIILYLDNAAYFKNPHIREWMKSNPAFQLEFLPPYSPNLNLIERLWGFMRKHAMQQFHPTFESMCKAIIDLLDNLSEHKADLDSLMNEKFEKINVPEEFKKAA